MSHTTLASVGQRERERVEEPQRAGVEREAGLGAHVAQARRRTSPSRGRIRSTSSADDDGVDAVVLARVVAVDVDGDQLRRLRLEPVLRVHAVEVGAERDHEVGLVPQPAGGRDVRRHADVAPVPGREHAARAVGGQHGRGEPLGERAHLRRARRARRSRPRSAAARRRRSAGTGRRGRRRSGRARVRRLARADLRRASRSVGTSRYDGPPRRRASRRAHRGARPARRRPGDARRDRREHVRLAVASRAARRGRRPARRSVVGMSVAITRIGDREAHASPTAPSVFAAPGPVVVSATPSRPVARA